jgi:hypothetical protein
VLLTSHFDPTHSRRDAWVRVVANAGGGSLGALAHWVLVAAPSLITLSLLSFLLAFGFGVMMAGAPGRCRRWCSPTAAASSSSSAIAAGPSSAGVALERVVYFSLAGLFVTVAMFLAWAWFDGPPQAATA